MMDWTPARRRAAPLAPSPHWSNPMTCTTMLLALAFASLPKGTCTLVCPITNALVVAEDNGAGKASTERGTWFDVHRFEGDWVLILEQLPEQCEERHL